MVRNWLCDLPTSDFCPFTTKMLGHAMEDPNLLAGHLIQSCVCNSGASNKRFSPGTGWIILFFHSSLHIRIVSLFYRPTTILILTSRYQLTTSSLNISNWKDWLYIFSYQNSDWRIENETIPDLQRFQMMSSIINPYTTQFNPTHSESDRLLLLILSLLHIPRMWTTPHNLGQLQVTPQTT